MKFTYCNDSDPKAKERWDKWIADAEEWARDLDDTMLDYQYRKAFQVLRIDPKGYGVRLQTKGVRRVFKVRGRLAAITRVTYERIAAISLPYLSAEDKTAVLEENGIKEENRLTDKVRKEHQFWAHALPMIRMLTVFRDCTSKPDLEPLARGSGRTILEKGARRRIRLRERKLLDLELLVLKLQHLAQSAFDGPYFRRQNVDDDSWKQGTVVRADGMEESSDPRDMAVCHQVYNIAIGVEVG